MEGKPKQSQGKLQKVSVDRISNLPDSILAHILSFLPTKDSVATLLLSKRWKFIWRYTSSLHFCHVIDQHISTYDDVKYMKFANFVTRVLLLHDVKSIDKLVIDFSNCFPMRFGPIAPDHLNNWVATAVARNVKSFKFHGGLGIRNNLFQFPMCIFTSSSLEILDLSNFTKLRPSGVILLPSLRILRLRCNRFQCVESVGKLISCCLSLHTLYFENVRYDDGRVFFKRSLTLQHLTIISSTGNRPNTACGCVLYIHAPALKYLRLDDCRYRDFTMGRSPSFVEANIAFNEQEFSLRSDHPSSVNIFEAIYNLKILSLDESAFMAIGKEGLSDRFKKLTKLTVYHCCGYQKVMDFLIGSNTLETLTLKQVTSIYNHDPHDNWTEPDRVPECVHACLKVVSIDGFSDREDHIAMVEYILKNSGQLESLRLKTIPMADGKRNKTIQKISSFERRSKKCKIDFSSNCYSWQRAALYNL